MDSFAPPDVALEEYLCHPGVRLRDLAALLCAEYGVTYEGAGGVDGLRELARCRSELRPGLPASRRRPAAHSSRL